MSAIENVKDLPIDKGEYLSNKNLQQAIGKPIEWGDLLSVRDFIHKNYNITCKVEGNGLRLLNSAENAVYANKMTWLRIVGAKWWHNQQLVGTDVKDLSRSEREQFNRNIEQTGKVIQSIESTIKAIMPVNIDNYQSFVPKILGNKD